MEITEPPIDEHDYLNWLEATLGVVVSGAPERIYRANAAIALQTVQAHQFFIGLEEALKAAERAYSVEYNANLLMGNYSVRLQQKTYVSAINKSYRHNVIRNNTFPNEPQGGWMLPSNLFTMVNDIIRGTIVCKYIDGPNFLATYLSQYAVQLNLTSYFSNRQSEEGYYAYHFYVDIPVEINDLDMSNLAVNLRVELQITTQLQEVLYQITHRYYKQTRNERNDNSSWKWEVHTNRFRSGYISHTLHLLEAIILELRDEEPESTDQPNGEAI